VDKLAITEDPFVSSTEKGSQEAGNKVLLRVLVLTCLLEIVTALLRFAVGIQSTRDFASTIGVLTQGIRIHHSYLGLGMIAIAALWRRRFSSVMRWILIIGLAFVFSDLIHHFLVLWPITGHPEFDLFYPY